MAPRKRLNKNRGLEGTNLYTSTKGGVTYFSYRHPVTGQYHGMGTDKRKAMAAARQLNARLITDEDLVGSVLGTSDRNMAELIKVYRKEILPGKKLAQGTLNLLGYRLDRIERDLGNRLVENQATSDIAEYLNKNFKRNAYVKHRGTLIELFRFAKMLGWFPSQHDNPAEVTYSKTDYEKDRQRLTLDALKAIHANSPGWMQVAIELSLVTLQGRNEIINCGYADAKGGWLYFVRQKSESKEWAYIRIRMTAVHERIIKKSRDDIPSPYIVHRMPKRRKTAKGRTHWTQIDGNWFSRRFREIRDETGLFDDVPREKRPTFHEVRALGSWLYEKKGYDVKYVQALMAHGDEEMTEYYQSGHDDEIKWMDVEAGLDVSEFIG
ncbi:phage integrase Arm DNA-binding domain-containing protein [Marinobacter sp. BGYM27]|uniref:phage integrase Arm DNA-binding domain-containing protein n=1 Tax=Marinobacter sp. BGYM27 TaxID=2975597 RepID=UPI0021A8C206|nr:phage integrase Arm DNA-binding domain-containing protein [Marinobacter sp. BGYM27]MDG5498920.1 phage integrase Arm DNA-binding domain-containing protein [Marinobacter sp. BGYM27]